MGSRRYPRAVDVSTRITLGNTGLSPTRLGLGLAPVGGLFTPVSDEQAAATIDRAWERGVRLYDTAPLYGYGSSERRAGAALAGRPRDQFVLASKVGRLLGPASPDSDARQEVWADPPPGVAPRFDFTAGGVRRCLADSLARLGVQHIDIAHLHDPDDHWPQAAGEAYQALEALRAGGAIGAVSVGMNQTAMLTRFVRERRLDCIMVAGRYTLLDQSAADQLLPACAERGVGVLAAGVYNSGVLANPRPGATYDYAPADLALLVRARAIATICEQYAVPLRAAAVQFPLQHPAVSCVVVGARSPAEVDAALAAFEYEIPATLWRTLQDGGLLRRSA
jgi:aryl-alcohol dehydrogenase-like predicted oxidoreductase